MFLTPLIIQEVHVQTTMKHHLRLRCMIIKDNSRALAVAMAINMVTIEKNMEVAQKSFQ